MRKPFILAFVLATVLIACVFGFLTHSRKAAAQSMPDDRAPVLINTCLVTSDVNKLSAFYSKVLKTEPEKTGNDYVEFRTGAGVLAIFSADAQEKYIPGSAKPGENHSAILEFKVSDVDQEYTRLHAFVQIWVKGPTNQPWGTRSIYFRDPDGNLVDFFTTLNSA